MFMPGEKVHGPCTTTGQQPKEHVLAQSSLGGQKRTVIQPGDHFIVVDLKDAYFHTQVAPHHRRFLRFAFEGVEYQFKALHECSTLIPETQWNAHADLND